MEQPEKLTLKELTSSFVKQKIKAHVNKTQPKSSRARASTPPIILKARKKLKAVLNQFPDKTLEEAIEVLAGQLKATKKMWDVNARELIEIPDEKIRQDAALAILAYEWGRPVERKIQATGDFKDFPDLIDRLNSSEAFRESYDSLQKTLEDKEVKLALPTQGA